MGKLNDAPARELTPSTRIQITSSNAKRRRPQLLGLPVRTPSDRVVIRHLYAAHVRALASARTRACLRSRACMYGRACRG